MIELCICNGSDSLISPSPVSSPPVGHRRQVKGVMVDNERDGILHGYPVSCFPKKKETTMPQPPHDVDPLFEDLLQDLPPETVADGARVQSLYRARKVKPHDNYSGWCCWTVGSINRSARSRATSPSGRAHHR